MLMSVGKVKGKQCFLMIACVFKDINPLTVPLLLTTQQEKYICLVFRCFSDVFMNHLTSLDT